MRLIATIVSELSRLLRPIFLRTWCIFVAARLPLRHRLIPQICQRPIDKTRRLRALCGRYDYFRQKLHVNLAHLSINSTLTQEQTQARSRGSGASQWMSWQYVAQDRLVCKIIPWFPLLAPKWISDQFHSFSLVYYRCLLADTLLIMRQGDFSNLSADDIYEYCVQHGSPTFIEFARPYLEAGTNPADEVMKRAMIPVLEKRARKLLSIDWTRVHPISTVMLEPASRLFDMTSGDAPCGK